MVDTLGHREVNHSYVPMFLFPVCRGLHMGFTCTDGDKTVFSSPWHFCFADAPAPTVINKIAVLKLELEAENGEGEP